MAEHAFLAPSSAQRIVACPASVREEPKYPDTPKRYTAEGTLAHDLAAMTLKGEIVLQEKLGKVYEVDGFEFTVDQVMIDHVQGYVDFINDEAHGADACLIERRVRYGPMVFKPEDHLQAMVVTPDGVEVTADIEAADIGYGTSDAIIIRGSRVTIVDLKYGYTRVVAQDNEQGMLYALGVLYEYSFLGDFTEVEVVIYQPRVDPDAPYTRWVISVEDLHVFAALFREAALTALNDPDAPYNPGEKQCQFCRVGPFCEARKSLVADWSGSPADASDFDEVVKANIAAIPDVDAEYLGRAMFNLPFLEDFIKAVRAEVERRLNANQEVPGWMLAEGRLGNRKWKDAEAVETVMRKTWKLSKEKVYDFSLISPTTAEKVFKAEPERWQKLQAHIERAPGKPTVTPVSAGKAPYQLSATAADFDS